MLATALEQLLLANKQAIFNILGDEDSQICSLLLPSMRQQHVLIKVVRGGKDAFLKFYAGNSLENYQRELRFTTVLGEHGMPVPEIIHFGTTVIGGNNLAFLMTAPLQGTELQDLLPGMSAPSLETVCQSMALQLKRQKDILVHDQDLKDGTPTLLSNLDRVRERLTSLGIENKTISQTMAACEARARPLSEPDRMSYVTHDWRLRHIFVNQQLQQSGLLDLEYTKPNDFAVEVAHLLHDIKINGAEKGSQLGMALLKAITSLYRDDPDFCQRTHVYLSKQALTHVLAKLAAGYEMHLLEKELEVAYLYQTADDLTSAVQVQF